MEKFKNFQGRTLDEAILEACGYYGVPREKLEIEIVNDAKSGIFGLVGVKKAEIRAARMQVAETLSAMLEDADAGAGTATSPPGSAPAPAGGKTPGRGGRLRGSRSAGHGADKGSTSVQETGRATPPARASSAKATPPVRDPAEMGAPSGQETGNAVPPSRDFSSHAAPPARDLSGSAGQARSAERGAFPASAVEEPDPPRPERGRSESDAEASGDEVGEYDAGSRVPTPEFDPASMDPEKLTDIVRSVVVGLAAPIVGDVPCRVDIGERWVRAVLDCGGNAGLLVGREGQTLAALQYLAGRIVAGKLGAPLRLQVDAGHYLERREDRLRDLALSLAEKVKTTRRAQATRPLSAYQRRIVHLALENDPDVLTHSKGEGLQRRVYIYLKNAAADPAPAGARFAADARPSGRNFSAKRARSYDAPAGAPYATDTAVAEDADVDPDEPDPWNR